MQSIYNSVFMHSLVAMKRAGKVRKWNSKVTETQFMRKYDDHNYR